MARVREAVASVDARTQCRWVAATVLVTVLAGCSLPSVSPSVGTSSSAAVPSQSNAPTARASPTASADVGFSDLEPGEVADIACGEAGPIFSPSGNLVACGRALYEWPAMASVVELQGRPISWGELDGSEALLLEVAQNSLATIDAAGTRNTVDTTGLDGSVIGTWAPSGDAVWLQSGLQTDRLRLDSWTLAGREQLISVPDAISATNITASSDAGSAAVFSRGCSASGCTFSLNLIDVPTSAVTSVALDMPGLLAEVWITDLGEILFSVDAGNGRFDLWRASPGTPPTIWFPQVSIWPQYENRLAFAGADGAFIVDLSTGTEKPLELPAGMQPANIISISADTQWSATSTDESSVVLSPIVGANGRGFEVPVPSLAPLSVRWTGNPSYAVFHTGPPFSSTVIRLAE